MTSNTPQEPAGRTGDDRHGAPVLVTGATGYIGGLLVPRLLADGRAVRVISRDADKLTEQPWHDDVEIVEGDATDEKDLGRALDGVGVAYYLLHSMDGEGDFRERDRELARTFAAACHQAGVRRIVYLGGMYPEGEELSEHLASRAEVGQIFVDSPVPAACLQAAVIVGSGSASFDMMRHLTERLPAMVAPKWLKNRIQPIAVDDALHYLAGAADLPADVNRAFDIGGLEVMQYGDMIQRFARVTGLRRRIIVTTPLLTPAIASRWIGAVTPVDTGVAKPLVHSLVHEVVCHDRDIDDPDRAVGPPPGGLMGFDDAVRLAMADAPRQRGPITLAATTAAVVAAATLGAVATQPDTRWYRKLDKPAWQPSPVLFPVVWTGLYASIAAASASVIRTLSDSGRTDESRTYQAALGTNLVLNAAWSVLFWRVRRLDVATAEAALLAVSSVDLARRAAAAGSGHAKALAPYAAWCTFATALTAELARRNR